MSTSANERLERLFANKPRPAKPKFEEPSYDSSSGSLCEISQACDIKSQANVSVSASVSGHGFAATSDDDDDEYTALFSKKPTMKEHSNKPQNKAESEPPIRANDGASQALKSSEYTEQGKKSAAEAYRSARTDNTEKDLVTTYKGNGSPLVGSFCVFNLAAKFPYKYMKDPNDRVSHQFFANNRFYDRRWHLHYLHPPISFDKGALILIPLTQMQKLVNEISSTFKINVNVPPFPFTLDFYDDNTPRPVFLGTSVSKQDYKDLIDKIPSAQPDHGECPYVASTDLTKAHEVFHEKVEQALLASKGKSTVGNQKKAKKVLQMLHESRNQMNRAQRYLGLKPKTKATASSEGLSWEEEKSRKEEQRSASGLCVEFLDISELAQYPFEHTPIFISFDVESYERNHGYITEVGVSTLDTLDLVDTPPGPAGENWIKHIRSRHFRIRGREHLVNKDFCIGNPEGFQFGTSEFVALNDISSAVDDCFEWPYSVQYKKAHAKNDESEDESNGTATQDDSAVTQKGPKERHLVLVGHDIGTDLDYLQQLGSEIFSPQFIGTASQSNAPANGRRHHVLTSILETLDTAQLYKVWNMELQPRSLGAICTNLGINPWFLHNAGNDARYTLEVLIKMLIQAKLNEDKGQRNKDPNSTGVIQDEWEAEKMRVIDERFEAARAKIERKVVGHVDETVAVAVTKRSPHVHFDDESTEIDWSLPLRGHSSSKKKQHKESKASLKKGTTQHETSTEATVAKSPSTAAPTGSILKPPRAGW